MPSAATIVPSFLTPIFTHIDAPEVGTRAAEYVFTGHLQPDRQTGFLGQDGGHRFQVGDRLAAEAAADLGRGDAQIAQAGTDDLRGQRAHLEVALAGGPDFALAVGLVFRDAGVRLDVGLMHGGGLEFLLDDDVSLLEASFDVAHSEFQALGDVGRFGRWRFDAAGDHVLEQQRRVRRHRFINVDDVRKDFIVHLDQRCGIFGDAAADRGDGGDGVALIQGFFARQDVAGDVPEIHRHALRPDVVEFLFREIGGGHDRLHAWKGLGGGGVD